MATQTDMTHAELLTLPTAFGLETAARAFGMGRTLAYHLAKHGAFPCRVLQVGRTYRVTRADLFRALGVSDEPAVVA